jgi:hypothetical protein
VSRARLKGWGYLHRNIACLHFVPSMYVLPIGFPHHSPKSETRSCKPPAHACSHATYSQKSTELYPAVLSTVKVILKTDDWDNLHGPGKSRRGPDILWSAAHYNWIGADTSPSHLQNALSISGTKTRTADRRSARGYRIGGSSKQRLLCGLVRELALFGYKLCNAISSFAHVHKAFQVRQVRQKRRVAVVNYGFTEILLPHHRG